MASINQDQSQSDNVPHGTVTAVGTSHHQRSSVGGSAVVNVASTHQQQQHYPQHRQHSQMSGGKGHRRAKSAGQAPTYASHYQATGLYAHHATSGDHLDSAIMATAAAQQIWSVGPNLLKKTASETTLPYSEVHHHYHYLVPQNGHYHPQYYYGYHPHHIHTDSHKHHHPSRHGSSIKYSSLKSRGLDTSWDVAVVGGTSGSCKTAESVKQNETFEPDSRCGMWNFYFRSLQRFARIQFFVFLCCILVTLQQALSSGYFNSVITTIEKRFDISSQMSGAIVSTFELGNLATIIFVSYFGTHRHIPRWIGTGIVVTAIGSLIFALPHFMSLSGPGTSGGNGTHGGGSAPGSLGNTCRIPQPALSSPFLEKASQFINPPRSHFDDPTCDHEATDRSNTPQMLVFMLAMVLIGCGGTPIFTLGTTYIDDHVPKESSSMYMGCMYSMVAFGLVCGFLLGSYFIDVHENAFGTGVTPIDIFPGHPKWIGAWWAGFILLGILLLIIAIPFFIFPKTLKPKRNKQELVAPSALSNPGATVPVGPVNGPATTVNHNVSSQVVIFESGHSPNDMALAQEDSSVMLTGPSTNNVTSHSVGGGGSASNTLTGGASNANKKYGRKIGEIPACMWRLATNPIYMVTCLGSCMELAIVSGFLIFLPKYLETQFSLGKSEANLFAGGIAIPGACVGIFLGGYLLKRLQLSPKGAIQVVLFFNLICMGLYTALYFLGCENVRMAGTTLPYANTSRFETFRVNLTSECNLGCRCSSNDLEPVCDLNNKISYYSPCFAGCTTVDNTGNIQNYSNCACLPQSSTGLTATLSPEITVFPLVTPGPCPQLCNAMLPFMVLLFVITLVVSITQMPVVMITLRSVAEEERSLALGMQFVLFRLFGYIPSPIVFGNVIDSTCLVWKAHCGQQGGFCLLYNIEQFRLRYVGVCSALKVTAGLLFFLDWLLICYREKKELKSSKSTLQCFSHEEVMSSIISLDRLSVFGANSSGSGWAGPETISETDERDEELQPLGLGEERRSALDSNSSRGSRAGGFGIDSDYNSAMDDEELTTGSTEPSSSATDLLTTAAPRTTRQGQGFEENLTTVTTTNSIQPMTASKVAASDSSASRLSTRHRRQHSQSHFV